MLVGNAVHPSQFLTKTPRKYSAAGSNSVCLGRIDLYTFEMYGERWPQLGRVPNNVAEAYQGVRLSRRRDTGEGGTTGGPNDTGDITDKLN